MGKFSSIMKAVASGTKTAGTYAVHGAVMTTVATGKFAGQFFMTHPKLSLALGAGGAGAYYLFSDQELTEAQLQLLIEKPLIAKEASIYAEFGPHEIFVLENSDPPLMYDHTAKKAYTVVDIEDEAGTLIKRVVEIKCTEKNGVLIPETSFFGGWIQSTFTHAELQGGVENTVTVSVPKWNKQTFVETIGNWVSTAREKNHHQITRFEEYQAEYLKIGNLSSTDSLADKYKDITETAMSKIGLFNQHNHKANFFALCKMMQNNELTLETKSTLEAHSDFAQLQSEYVCSGYTNAHEVVGAKIDSKMEALAEKTKEVGAPEAKNKIMAALDKMANNKGLCIVLGVVCFLSSGLAAMVAEKILKLPSGVAHTVAPALGAALIALPFFGTSKAEQALGFLGDIDLLSSNTATKDVVAGEPTTKIALNMEKMPPDKVTTNVDDYASVSPSATIGSGAKISSPSLNT